MSVYIPNMEMPTSCNECRFAVDGWCYAYGNPNIDALANDGRTNFCPLVPVPPHGRLIDGDIAEVISYSLEDSKGNFADGILFAADWISEQPTIIEAEEADNGK